MDDFSKVLHEHEVLLEDWTTQPFVDIITIKDGRECPLEYEQMFSQAYKNENSFKDTN